MLTKVVVKVTNFFFTLNAIRNENNTHLDPKRIANAGEFVLV